MKTNNPFVKFLSKFYVYILLLLLYAPILVLIVFSFTPSRLIGNWSGFSLSLYSALFKDKEIMQAFGEVPPKKRLILEQLVKDFCKWANISAQLDGLPTFEVDPKNPKRQRKLPAHDMLKDAQQRTTELARALLRIVDGESEEESPILKMIKEFRGDE